MNKKKLILSFCPFFIILISLSNYQNWNSSDSNSNNETLYANRVENIIDSKGSNTGFTKNAVELYNLIDLFSPDQKLDYNLYDWKTQANNKSIHWLTSGVKMGEHDFYREGEAIVTINSKVLECLENTSQSCKWDIVLRGVRNGYTSFEISSVTSQELEEITIDQLLKNHKFEAKIVTYDDFSKTYLVTFPHKKPVEMRIQFSCGSAGCSLKLTCKTMN